MEPIETAAELYREIKRRGLHLRSGYGRDDSLVHELALRIGCPDLQLQRYLDGSALSAKDFLKSYLRVAQPFAQMFEDIWQYLSQKTAPGALETISIRFGFPDADGQIDVDLEAFRRYVESSRRVMATVDIALWPFEALHKLFTLGRILVPERLNAHDVHYTRYEPGKPYVLPEILPRFHKFDDILARMKAVFQQIIDDYAREKTSETEWSLPELVDDNYEEERNMGLRNFAYLLTDLLPMWYPILKTAKYIASEQKNQALQYYSENIEPVLTRTVGRAPIPVLEALDVLDLPFWRHRWHTYEIWATILTLHALDQYKPEPRITTGGRIPFDGFTEEIVAHLAARDYPNACVAVQVQTEFERDARKAIKPDLRICFSNTFAPEETAAVVEFKQRAKLSPDNIHEIATAYRDGCPRTGGVIVINYDISGLSTQMPDRCYLFEGMRPGNSTRLKEFGEQLLCMLKTAKLLPNLGSVVVLLDVSSSMGSAYTHNNVPDALKRLLNIPRIKILCFNNGLLPGADLDESACRSIRTSGGTQLGQALDDMEHLIGPPDRLLVVTDGEHDHPVEKLQAISEVRECTPAELSHSIDWLMS